MKLERWLEIEGQGTRRRGGKKKNNRKTGGQTVERGIKKQREIHLTFSWPFNEVNGLNNLSGCLRSRFLFACDQLLFVISISGRRRSSSGHV